MSTMLRNLRFAVRALRKAPAFTATAILCLGVALGANVALFAIFNTLLWKPLPVAHPERLVRAFTKGRTQTLVQQGFSLPEYEDYARDNGVLDGLAATTGTDVAFRSKGRAAVRAFGEAVSDNYFDLLGLQPRLGRLFPPAPAGAANSTLEVVLSHRFWKGRLQSDPGVIGTTVWMTGVPFTVVGVTAPGFHGTYPSPVFAPDLWIPLGALPHIQAGSRSALHNRGERSLALLGRLKPGVTMEQARAAFDAIALRLERGYPESNAGVRATLYAELDTHPEVSSSRTVNLAAFLFLGLADLVLLVACANLASLVLARAASRRKETALRLALGARRGQVALQLLAEAVVLSVAAGAVGLLVALAAAAAVSSIRLPTDLPIVLDVRIDPRTLWFTLAISLASAVVFGLLPALGASRQDLVTALKDTDRGAGAGRRRFTLANALVVAQVAFSVVLLVAAGLFWRSIAGSEAVATGMQVADRTLVSFNPSLVRYDAAQAATFYGTLLERVQQMPEMEKAALASWVPLGFAFDEAPLVVHGRDAGQAAPRAADRTTCLLDVVSPGYFDTVGVPVRSGRAFTSRDDAGAPPVVVVNETLARQAWPGQEAVGRQLRLDRAGAPWLTVVGVVADGKYRTLTEPARPCLFRPWAQSPEPVMTLVVKRRNGHANAVARIRGEVQAIDPDMPLLDAKTMDQQMAKVRFLPRAMTALAGPAAIAAILIAAIGLYGVVLSSVGRRRREFGIKLAVGAQRHHLVAEVMRYGLFSVAIGLAIGFLASSALSRLLGHMLVGVTGADPLVLIGTVVLLTATSALATFLPARGASRVDPLAAIRQD